MSFDASSLALDIPSSNAFAAMHLVRVRVRVKARVRVRVKARVRARARGTDRTRGSVRVRVWSRGGTPCSSEVGLGSEPGLGLGSPAPQEALTHRRRLWGQG